MRFAVVLALGSLALVSPACTSRDAPASETTGAQCSNARDDDDDGLVDCDDPACRVHAWCTGGDGDGGVLDGSSMPVDSGPRPDVITPTCVAPLDVVFVLDVSTSMDDEAAAMRDGIESIWNAAHALTTDTQFGLVVFVDDALADGGCAPAVDLASLRGRFDYWRGFCAGNRSPVSMTSNSDCAENSLDALWTAAQSCPWREGATRVIIHVTDDTFAERPAVLSEIPFVGGGVPVQHTYAEVAAELMRLQLRVGAFAAPTPEYCGAGTSDDVARGFHTPYMGMPSLPTQTGGRVWNIRDVRAGTLDMAEAINALIAEEYCTLY